jgi:hypothetical protein
MFIDDEVGAKLQGYFEVNSQYMHVTTNRNDENAQVYERRITSHSKNLMLKIKSSNHVYSPWLQIRYFENSPVQSAK